MKRFALISFLVLLFTFPAKSQFWIHFEWNAPVCEQCRWMEEELYLPYSVACEYQHIIHKYGRKIEREARRNCSYWDNSARRIYRLRMERDRRLQRILTPRQFEIYIYHIRHNPRIIHDYVGWFDNPNYPNYRPSRDCFWYEDSYWRGDWRYDSGHWNCHFDSHSWYPGKYHEHYHVYNYNYYFVNNHYQYRDDRGRDNIYQSNFAPQTNYRPHNNNHSEGRYSGHSSSSSNNSYNNSGSSARRPGGHSSSSNLQGGSSSGRYDKSSNSSSVTGRHSGRNTSSDRKENAVRPSRSGEQGRGSSSRYNQSANSGRYSGSSNISTNRRENGNSSSKSTYQGRGTSSKSNNSSYSGSGRHSGRSVSSDRRDNKNSSSRSSSYQGRSSSSSRYNNQSTNRNSSSRQSGRAGGEKKEESSRSVRGFGRQI